MIEYLIKSGLCLALLLVLYHLLLEREKMHRFNRFYLLFAIIFGLSIPFLSVDILSFSNTSSLNFSFLDVIPESSSVPFDEKGVSEKISSGSDFSTFSSFLYLIYGIVTISFLFRFLNSIKLIRKQAKNSERLKSNRAHICLISENIIPHSFLNYIFLSKKEYKLGQIQKEIIDHELTHVHQLHSLDILFIEVLKIFLWFNPIFYFYKKAIQLNHEFLADEKVANAASDISFYQKLLLEKAKWNQELKLTSNFNFSLTKKRFIMMNKPTNKKSIACKQLLVIPLLLITVILFSASSEVGEAANFPLQDSDVVEFMEITNHPSKAGGILIRLSLAQESKVLLKIYNSDDDEMAVIIDKNLNAGNHQILFDRSNLPEDHYFYTLMADETVVSKGSFFTESGETPGIVIAPKPTPSPADELKKEITEAAKELQKKGKKYMQLDANKTSLEDLKAAYQEMMEALEKVGRKQDAYYEFINEKAPPLPPIPPNPEYRKEHN